MFCFSAEKGNEDTITNFHFTPAPLKSDLKIGLQTEIYWSVKAIQNLFHTGNKVATAVECHFRFCLNSHKFLRTVTIY